jgi:hypothetical protein
MVEVAIMAAVIIARITIVLIVSDWGYSMKNC